MPPIITNLADEKIESFEILKGKTNRFSKEELSRIIVRTMIDPPESTLPDVVESLMPLKNGNTILNRRKLRNETILDPNKLKMVIIHPYNKIPKNIKRYAQIWGADRNFEAVIIIPRIVKREKGIFIPKAGIEYYYYGYSTRPREIQVWDYSNSYIFYNSIFDDFI